MSLNQKTSANIARVNAQNARRSMTLGKPEPIFYFYLTNVTSDIYGVKLYPHYCFCQQKNEKLAGFLVPPILIYILGYPIRVEVLLYS